MPTTTGHPGKVEGKLDTSDKEGQARLATQEWGNGEHDTSGKDERKCCGKGLE